MSFESCVRKVRDVAKEIDDELVNEAADEIASRIKEIEAKDGVPRLSEEIVRAANDVIRDREVNLTIQKRQAMLNRLRKLEVIRYIKDNFSDDAVDGVRAVLVGTNSNKVGSRFSAAAMQTELRDTYLTGVADDLDRLGPEAALAFKNGSIDEDIARELFRLTDAAGPEGKSKIAKQIAEVVHKWQEIARADANRAGAAIPQLKGYIVNQSHDMFKIRQSKEEWMQFMMDNLDWAATERARGKAINKRQEFLDGVYEGVSTGAHFTADGQGASGPGFANLGRRAAVQRLLHFKDADSWFNYNKEFGLDNIREAIFHGLERSASNTGLMQKLGPSARDNLNEVINQVGRSLKGEDRVKFANSRAKFDNFISELDGSTRIPGNATAAQYSAVIRAFTTMGRLGLSVLTSVADLATVSSELKYQGSNMFTPYHNMLGGVGAGLAKSEKRSLLNSLGVAMESMQYEYISRWDAHDSLPGKISRLQSLYFKYNLLTPWTDRVRSASALSMSNLMASNKKLTFNALNPDTKRVLELFDINAREWDILRKYAIETAENGQEFMVTNKINDIPLKEFHGKSRLREDLRRKYHSYLVDRTDHAVIRPDQRTNAILRQGSQPGTPLGELIRFITQFKGFPVAFSQKVLGREIYGRGSNTFLEAMRSGQGSFTGLVGVFVQSTILGYLGMSLKDMAKGREPRDPFDGKTALASMLQGGGMGFYGDFLFGELKKTYGGGPISGLVGPVLGAGEDIFDIIGRARDGDVVAPKLTRFLINNTPGVATASNLLYTRWAFDYLVTMQIQESLNPGYMKRVERRLDENGTPFIVSPREVY